MRLLHQLNFMTQVHKRSRTERHDLARVESAAAIGRLVDEAARELTTLSGVKRAELKRLVDIALAELQASEVETRPEQEAMS